MAATSGRKLPYISNDDIECNLTWDELIPLLESGIKRYSRHEFGVIQPVRTTFAIPQHSSLFYTMSCFCEQEDVICTKLLTVNPNNAGKCVPTHASTIHLFRGSTGIPLAILEGELITAWRTAAASAIATKLLVNGTPKTLAILGSGVQARSHYKVLNHLFDFEEVRIWNVGQESAKKFVSEIKESGRNGIVCETVQMAVNDADVICTVTDSSQPILELTWVKPGAHINAVGACRFNKQEIEPALMKAATVYVDCSKTALQESGDVLQSGAKIFAEIGEVLDGKKEAKTEEITVYKSLGMAIEDAVAATLVYNKIRLQTNS